MSQQSIAESDLDPQTKQTHPTVAQLAQLIAKPDGPFTKRPKRGYKRGIDFYTASQLPLVIRAGADQFFETHDRYPNFYAPELLNDKVFASKFLRPLKVPETGNKLMTSSFIPPEAQDLVSCAPVVWHSKTERIPQGNEIEPGVYYLKTTHGCDMFQRVIFPLSDPQADALDLRFRPLLGKRYGLKTGNWWHTCFEPELMLEKAIGSEEFTTSLNYVVMAGEIVRLTAYQKLKKGYRKTNFEPDWTPYDNTASEPAQFANPSAAAKDRMAKAAGSIGRGLGYVRLDFLLDDDERPYLGEVTFTPGNALTIIAAEAEAKLGRLWDWSAMVEKEKLVPPAM